MLANKMAIYWNCDFYTLTWQEKEIFKLRASLLQETAKNSSWPVTGLRSRGPLKELKDSKLILKESKLFPWSSRFSLVPFRTFRGPLFPKPVTGQELFLAVSYSKPVLIITVSGNIRPHWEMIQTLPYPSITRPFLRVKPQVPRSFHVPAALLTVILLAVRQGSPPQTHQSSPNPFSYSFTRAHMIRM